MHNRCTEAVSIGLSGYGEVVLPVAPEFLGTGVELSFEKRLKVAHAPGLIGHHEPVRVRFRRISTL